MESADWRIANAEFFNRPPAQVASELLGARLVRLADNHLLSGRIVETVPGWTHDVTNVGADEMVCLLWANEIFDRTKPDTIVMKVDA